jgi:hypothetical protein
MDSDNQWGDMSRIRELTMVNPLCEQLPQPCLVQRGGFQGSSTLCGSLQPPHEDLTDKKAMSTSLNIDTINLTESFYGGHQQWLLALHSSQHWELVDVSRL